MLALVIALTVNMANSHNPNGNDMFPPELRDNPALAQLALSGLVSLMALFSRFYFMIAYAIAMQPPGMNSALWTLMVIIFIPTWGLIGLIIYLLMREHCPTPARNAHHRECALQLLSQLQCNLHPSCPQCKREVGELDKFCPIAVMTCCRERCREREQLRSAGDDLMFSYFRIVSTARATALPRRGRVRRCHA